MPQGSCKAQATGGIHRQAGAAAAESNRPTEEAITTRNRGESPGRYRVCFQPPRPPSTSSTAAAPGRPRMVRVPGLRLQAPLEGAARGASAAPGGDHRGAVPSTIALNTAANRPVQPRQPVLAASRPQGPRASSSAPARSAARQPCHLLGQC